MNYYCENDKSELVQTINRVLVLVYELGNEKTLKALIKSLEIDLEKYLK